MILLQLSLMANLWPTSKFLIAVGITVDGYKVLLGFE